MKSYRDNPLQGLSSGPAVVYFPSFPIKDRHFLCHHCLWVTRVRHRRPPSFFSWGSQHPAAQRSTAQAPRLVAATTPRRPSGDSSRQRAGTVIRSIEVNGTLAAVDEVAVTQSEPMGSSAASCTTLATGSTRRRHGGARIAKARSVQTSSSSARRWRARGAVAAPRPAAPCPRRKRPQRPESERGDLAQAKQSFDRASQLFKRTLVPQQTLDDAATALQSKQASYDSSLQRQNLPASIAAADAAMKLANRQLRDTYIRAPFNRYVQRRFVNLGQLVKGSGTPGPVMTVVRVNPLRVTGEIPEKMVPGSAVGQPVEIHVDAYPDKAIAGKMSRAKDQSGGEQRDARVPVRGARAQRRGAAEARHVRVKFVKKF